MKITLVLLLVGLLVGCAFAQTENKELSPADDMNKTKVVVNIFSGRENPSWEICSCSSNELLTMVDALPKTDGAIFPDGLGYTGIRVTIPIQGTNESEELFIFEDRLRRTSANQVRFYIDEKRAIESFVIKTADGRLDAVLLTIIQNAVGPPENK